MIEPPQLYSDARQEYDARDLELLGKFAIELGLQENIDIRHRFERLLHSVGTKFFGKEFCSLQQDIMGKVQANQFGKSTSLSPFRGSSPYGGRIGKPSSVNPALLSSSPAVSAAAAVIASMEGAFLSENHPTGAPQTSSLSASDCVPSGYPQNTVVLYPEPYVASVSDPKPRPKSQGPMNAELIHGILVTNDTPVGDIIKTIVQQRELTTAS